jgi:hypothetical protein
VPVKVSDDSKGKIIAEIAREDAPGYGLPKL